MTGPRPQRIGGALRPGIVHRLDKDTSGVMVVAKSDRAHAALGAAFAAKGRGEPGGIVREYLGVTAPPPPVAAGTLHTLHGRHPTDRKRFSSRVATGKPAITGERPHEPPARSGMRDRTAPRRLIAYAGAMTTPRLRDFERIVFFTGAGLSAESGIPTYRGHGGIWKEYNYEDYACQRAFDRDPDKVWDFHDKRRAAVAACEPNAGHRMISEVQGTRPATAIITQNIDGLHARAGGRDVIELHGSLWRVRCDREGLVRDDTSVPMQPRRCSCGAYLRPDIVWFEDRLDPRVLSRAEQALERADLIVSIGTSGVVYPAADLPRIAVAAGAVSVEINLEDTPVSGLYQHRLRGKASAMLAALR